MQPFNNLARFAKDFDWRAIPFLPNSLSEHPDNYLIKVISEYDLVIIQRCYLAHVVNRVHAACQFLGKPLVFETDDDYLNLEPHNPCYWGMVPFSVSTNYKEQQASGDPDRIMKAYQEMEQSRVDGLNDYKKLISKMDGVIVSTEELKRTLYPYNKNIVVMQNNIEQVYPHKDYIQEESCRYLDDDGQMKVSIPSMFGMHSVPSWCHFGDEKFKQVRQTPRVGYTGTPSHRGRDFDTIQKPFFNVLNEFKNDTWTVYIGDPYFFLKQKYQHRSEQEVNQYLGMMQAGRYSELPPSKYGTRAHYIPASEYNLYSYNIRNLDISVAPLQVNMFNMSKSDIKAVEAAAWGTAPLLPNYITYNRNFIDNETCLMYNNEEEFKDQLTRLIKDHKLRKKIGDNALDYVRNNRLERLHCEMRYTWLEKQVKESYPLKIHHPNKVGIS